MTEVQDITTVEQFDQAIASSQGAVIDFHAEWCGPCKLISPKFKAHAKTYGDKLKFYAVDVDALPEVAERCSIESMPTFQVWRDNKKAAEMKGAVPAKLEAMVKNEIEASAGTAPAAEATS